MHNAIVGGKPITPLVRPVLQQTSVKLENVYQTGMQLNQILMRVVVRKVMVRSGMLFGFFLWLVSTHAPAQTSAAGSAPHAATGAISISVSAGHDPVVDAAFEHFYNMEYDRAI